MANTIKARYDAGVTNFGQDGTAVAIPIPNVIGGIGEQKSNDGTQYYQQDRIYDSTSVSPALQSNLPGGGNKVAIPVLTPDRAEKRQNGRRFKDDGEPSFTLTAQDVHGVAIEVDVPESEHPGIYVQLDDDLVVWAVWYEKYQCYIAIRKLTPRECFRLQGWDDEYFERAEFVNSDSQLYKQAGNGVTVNVVYEIGKAIKEYEYNQPKGGRT